MAAIFVTAGLYHGGELLSPLICTYLYPISLTPRFNEHLEMQLQICDIPRVANMFVTTLLTRKQATRLCLTLYGRTSKDEAREVLPKDVPLAWVNCLLFDYKHELIVTAFSTLISFHFQTGRTILQMWPGESANPIGTCNSNFAAAEGSCPILCLEFPKYQLPVVFPTVKAGIQFL